MFLPTLTLIHDLQWEVFLSVSRLLDIIILIECPKPSSSPLVGQYRKLYSLVNQIQPMLIESWDSATHYHSSRCQYYDDGSTINEPLCFLLRTSLRTSLAQLVEPNTSPGLFSPSLPLQRPITTTPFQSISICFYILRFSIEYEWRIGCQHVTRQQILRPWKVITESECWVYRSQCTRSRDAQVRLPNLSQEPPY